VHPNAQARTNRGCSLQVSGKRRSLLQTPIAPKYLCPIELKLLLKIIRNREKFGNDMTLPGTITTDFILKGVISEPESDGGKFWRKEFTIMHKT